MAAEDYHDFDYPPEYDNDHDDPFFPPRGGTAYPRERIRPGSLRTIRFAEVAVPGSKPLSDLVPGETFRFAQAKNAANVYMVIEEEDAPYSGDVRYILLNSGKVYSSRPNKPVVQVDIRVSILGEV